MNRERLKEELRRQAMEMVEKVCADMPDSLRCFQRVERAVKEGMQELQVKESAKAASPGLWRWGSWERTCGGKPARGDTAARP